MRIAIFWYCGVPRYRHGRGAAIRIPDFCDRDRGRRQDLRRRGQYRAGLVDRRLGRARPVRYHRRGAVARAVTHDRDTGHFAAEGTTTIVGASRCTASGGAAGAVRSWRRDSGPSLRGEQLRRSEIHVLQHGPRAALRRWGGGAGQRATRGEPRVPNERVLRRQRLEPVDGAVVRGAGGLSVLRNQVSARYSWTNRTAMILHRR